jgi:hypothetical protein
VSDASNLIIFGASGLLMYWAFRVRTILRADADEIEGDVESGRLARAEAYTCHSVNVRYANPILLIPLGYALEGFAELWCLSGRRDLLASRTLHNPYPSPTTS